tara:strand:- start:4087 stop:4479 length:393 start_codon:yes stop_codon:yes gene_type:complete
MKKVNLACLVEDDPIHVFITKKQLEIIGLAENLMVCKNGKEAYDKMRAIIKAGESLPDLILLDLNMPIWDGWRFLEEFIKIPARQQIIIFILTSSTSKADIKKAEEFNLRSNYLVKPVTLESLKDALEQI